ncbi:MAG: ATP-binding cassette domain-containing protein [Defluviitaleaceae bacterium]|nr:ATP-binding cassette domain-containing protein [Defluviitaleaceae bacterium]
MLSIRNLSKTFGNNKNRFKALDNVSVDVLDGEIFGFVGLSGAGKTSLARCVATLEKADNGEIFLDGVDLIKLKGRKLRLKRRKMGFVFQHFHLLMNSTVYDNIAFPLIISKTPKAEIRKRVDELLELVGLTDKASSYPSKLSGGQKQRVGIARALANKPELLICDEATSALDPDTTKSILQLIKKINEQTGVTVIVITHEMEVIKSLCTRAAIMEDGVIIELGKVLDIITNPQTDTAQRFFTKEHLPEIIRLTESLAGNEVLVKAIFIGDKVHKPFISDIIRGFDIEVSILSGGIEPVGNATIGDLVLKMSGYENAIISAIGYCKENGVGIEVLKGGDVNGHI